MLHHRMIYAATLAAALLAAAVQPVDAASAPSTFAWLECSDSEAAVSPDASSSVDAQGLRAAPTAR